MIILIVTLVNISATCFRYLNKCLDNEIHKRPGHMLIVYRLVRVIALSFYFCGHFSNQLSFAINIVLTDRYKLFFNTQQCLVH